LDDLGPASCCAGRGCVRHHGRGTRRRGVARRASRHRGGNRPDHPGHACGLSLQSRLSAAAAQWRPPRHGTWSLSGAPGTG